MSEPIRRRLRLSALGAVLAVAAASFFIGIRWGLPGRAVDPFLFGNQSPWDGAKIAALAPSKSDDRGADVDANPIADRQKTLVLNETDAQRAEIIRRYRLFSYQPDEMITFMSLSRLKQNRGDPRLYQYGGLWIYPVGVLLKLASVIGYVDLRADQTFYLDHPEAFARFYVVARFYSACWGIAGAWAVFWIVRRISGELFIATAAGLCFATMPVVVNLAHEAKPHLAGTTLMLLAIIAATKFIDTGKTAWAIATGALCGAAFGMIISALVAFVIPVVMVFLPADPKRRRISALASALAAGVIVFVITNPFILINILFHPERLRSNIQNSTAMYAPSSGGLGNVIRLLMEGASPMLLIVGALAGVFFIWRHPVGRLMLAPAGLVAAIFLALATGKPPEYARFALFLDVTLMVAAFTALARARHHWPRVAMVVLLVLFTAGSAFPYWLGFIRDCAPITSRLAAAAQLQKTPRSTMKLSAEPAPYCCPPLDLFATRLELVPPAKPADITVDRAAAANSMSWADVAFTFSPTVSSSP